VFWPAAEKDKKVHAIEGVRLSEIKEGRVIDWMNTE
jgi:hypothetical protein